MSKVRVTIVIEDRLAAKVRQMFGGNLSKGVNTLLEERMAKNKKSMFGALKGSGIMDEWKKMKQEEAEEERKHERLYRGLPRLARLSG